MTLVPNLEIDELKMLLLVFAASDSSGFVSRQLVRPAPRVAASPTMPGSPS